MVARQIKAQGVLEQLGPLFIYRGLPGFIRSDNGPGFTAKAVRGWLERLNVQTLFIEPGSHSVIFEFHSPFAMASIVMCVTFAGYFLCVVLPPVAKI